MPGPSWNDIFDATGYDVSPSPSADQSNWHNDEQDVADFGTSTLDDDVVVLECPDCSRLVLPEAMPFHKQNCSLLTDIKEGKVSCSVLDAIASKAEIDIGSEEDEEDDKPLFSGSKSKKRKLDELGKPMLNGDDKSSKKVKGLPGRQHKGPVDVDRQCGVITEKGPCLRSLTCKSHSMGAKRAVPGRSAPYDELLLNWQKATNPAFAAKLEEKERAAAAATAAKAAAAEEKALKKKQKKAEQAAAAAAAKAAAQVQADADAWERENASGNHAFAPGSRDPNDPDADMYQSGAQDAEVDSELSSVLLALRRSCTAPRTTCMPLAARPQSSSFVTRSHDFWQYRGLIAHALRGRPPVSMGFSTTSLVSTLNRGLNGYGSVTRGPTPVNGRSGSSSNGFRAQA